MKELERKEELSKDAVTWSINATLPQLYKPPEEIYALLTDFRKAHIIPGITNARLIEGIERKRGARYACNFEFRRGFLSLDTLAELEVTHAQEPFSAGAVIKDASFDGILQVHAAGNWNIEKGANGGNDLHIQSQGIITGRGISLFKRLIHHILEAEIEHALSNIERELSHPQYTSQQKALSP